MILLLFTKENKLNLFFLEQFQINFTKERKVATLAFNQTSFATRRQ